MEELLELLPRWLVAAVVGPFLLGIALLTVLVQPTPTGQAFVYLLFGFGIIVFMLLALGLTLSIRQSKGLERQRGRD